MTDKNKITVSFDTAIDIKSDTRIYRLSFLNEALLRRHIIDITDQPIDKHFLAKTLREMADKIEED